MVQVRKAYPIDNDGRVLIDEWIDRLPRLPNNLDREQLTEACDVARSASQRNKGDFKGWVSSYETGLEMAEILSELHLDHETLVAAVLYRAVRERKLKISTVEAVFGESVAKLIMGVQQMAAISAVVTPHQEDAVFGQNISQMDNIRRMLVAMVNDVRVALIKLAERTCAIRGAKNYPEKARMKVANEVAEIYAPLAHRLGIGHIKWELEDLAFRYLQGDAYMRIASLLDERRLDRQGYIETVVSTLEEKMFEVNIDADVQGRAKHIYSIWRKMQRKNIGFSQVYDIRAVRILVPKLNDCYTALGIIHTMWRIIPNEFDDYIANPKENGYQSLHTAVIGPEGKVIEVQIRTQQMHDDAELGVCAHWRYKGTDENSDTGGYEEKISWLRQVLDWHEETDGHGDIAMQLTKDVTQERVYVFTPDGHVVDLSQGSTPLDFAYQVHTEVGHRCRGAKVDGRIVPLTYRLKTGEQVEVLTAKEAKPSRDWLRPGLAYLNSSRARSKVQHWFKLQDRDQNIESGRSQLEKEFKRLALTSVDFKEVATKVNYHSVEDMYAAVGAGDLSNSQVLNAAQRMVVEEDKKQETLNLNLNNRPGRDDSKESGIQVRGVGNLMTHMAGCCNPVPGDEIAGYITVGRGVSVHRQDCSKLLGHQRHEPERIIEVDWGSDNVRSFTAGIYIEAYDRHGLLRDITTLFANEKVYVTSINTQSDKHSNTATMEVSIEVEGLVVLSQLLSKINGLPNVVMALRKGEG
ncbi:GTP pyrophosphokinase [Sinobacterium caligoides]|uniref:GTP pyrophosphokinase n=1 Tax=Sinobacterium caligoides TaxID=933926 RepID=A0A3N2DYY9_9GAMM|nr:GTP diphosphokinase [Sinobacterium caligoides]ROS04709.1 GTP pyrophosphokinase [Sinobacterium caligoides]